MPRNPHHSRLVIVCDRAGDDDFGDRPIEALIGAHRQDGPTAERLDRGRDGIARVLRHRGPVHVIARGADAAGWARIGGWGLAATIAGSRPAITLIGHECARFVTTPGRALAARAALSLYEAVYGVDREATRFLSRLGVRPDRLHSLHSPTGAPSDHSPGAPAMRA